MKFIITVSGNFTVNKIVDIIKLKNKNTKIKFVDHKIMNQLSYNVDTKSFNRQILNLMQSLLEI